MVALPRHRPGGGVPRLSELKRLAKSARAYALKRLGPSRLDRPILLAGTVRSGSTLLARCLGAHPQVFYAGFELSAEWSRHAAVPIACPDTQDLCCPSLGADDIDEPAGRAIERHLAGLLAAGAKPGARLLNKNPHFWNKLELLRTVLPDAALIITSRDIRSTVASTKRLWRWIADNQGIRHYLPEDEGACWECVPPRSAETLDERRLFPGGDVSVIAEYWLRCHERMDIDRGRFQVRRCVRHRDFVASPRVCLDELARDLDLPASNYELATPIDPSRNRVWRERLSGAEIRDLDLFIRAHEERIANLSCADTTI